MAAHENTARTDPNRRHHDMGGLVAGPVTATEHDYAGWEKKVDAVVRLLSAPERGVITVDQLRRGIEDLGPGAYDSMTYYERWCASVTNLLIEQGVITVDALGRRMEAVAARWNADRIASAMKP